MNGSDNIKVFKDACKKFGEEVLWPNYRDRVDLYQVLDKNMKAQAYERELCFSDRFPQTNLIHFCRNHIWIEEPRKFYLDLYGFQNTMIPFCPFDFQQDFLIEVRDRIVAGTDLLCEKSRDMGATWMVLVVMVWFFLNPNMSGSQFLLGSNKFENVDSKGLMNTLFQKLRFILENMHKSIYPKSGIIDNVGKIINVDNSASFTGEANNVNYSRSGRFLATVLDEFSFWQETDSQAWTSTSDSTNCRIVVSTPNGFGRKFTDLRFSGAIDVFTLHWSDHPLKAAGLFRGRHPFDDEKKEVALSPWYLGECERRKDDPLANVGQELDIDYLTSGTPYFKNQMKYLADVLKKWDNEQSRSYAHYEINNDGRDVSLFKSYGGRLVIRKEPVAGWRNRYLISADVAEGLEHSDNSVLYVYDRVDLKDVAWFAGRIDTHVFAMLLAHMGYRYSGCCIAVERNNHGHAVLQELKLRYSNIYRDVDSTKIVDVEKVQLGVHTNLASKPIMMGKLRQILDSRCEGVFDRHFYDEARTLMQSPKNGKIGAVHGARDDRVVAQAIKFKVHDFLPAPQRRKSEIDKFKGLDSFGIPAASQNDIRTIWKE